jgi:SAM-dependent methyltransferase
MGQSGDAPTDAARRDREAAKDYDDWWFRRGRYDGGAPANARWFADAAEVQGALDRFAPTGKVLELARGTAFWTRQLLRHADSITATEAYPESPTLACTRLADPRVTYVTVDPLVWEPDDDFDVCFFAFSLLHVSAVRFEGFWHKVRDVLAPGGRVFFVELRRNALAFAHADEPAGYKMRELQLRLADLGWSSDLDRTPEFFLYGEATPIGTSTPSSP